MKVTVLRSECPGVELQFQGLEVNFLGVLKINLEFEDTRILEKIALMKK